MKKLLIAGLVALAGLASPACDRDDSRAAGRLSVEGTAEVATVDGSIREVTRSRTLRSGEQVTMVDGTATLSLGEDRLLELRKGTVLRLGLQTGPVGREVPRGELVTGDVLVQAANDPATVVAGDTTVEVNPQSVARVSRNLAVVVGVYRGAAGVESAGRPANIRALRQRTVPAPGLPSRETPITFSESDPWDQRFLGDAIDLGNQLVATSRGFINPPGVGPGSSVGLFLQILPQLVQPGFDPSLIDPTRAPGETLVGAAIALEGTKTTFLERWNAAFSFHDDGAPWGLVALDQGASRERLMATLDAAIRRLTSARTELAAPSAPTDPSSSTATTLPRTTNPAPAPLPAGTPGPGSTGGGTTGGGASAGTGTAGTGGSTPAGAEGSPDLEPYARVVGPSNLGVPLVDNTVNSVVETLSGVLRAIGRG